MTRLFSLFFIFCTTRAIRTVMNRQAVIPFAFCNMRACRMGQDKTGWKIDAQRVANAAVGA